MDDQRKNLRYNVTGRAQFQVAHTTRATIVRLLDISEAGISFLSEIAAPVQARARLSFKVLGDNQFHEASPVVVIATCVLERRMYRLGAKFVDLDEATRQSLDALIAARARVVQGH
jgi:c-di-GMP-binding flagellar brake protein YcgR